MEIFVILLAGLTSAGLLIYSVRGWLAFSWFVRVRHECPCRTDASAGSQAASDSLPVLTTQLPICNHGPAAERALRAVAALTYPQGRHQIQVLDDSNDDTRVIVERTARELRHAGHRIVVLHRRDKRGGRAGALAVGLRSAEGELVCVMDPQLTPPPDFLTRTVSLLLRDERLGVVHASAGSADDDSFTGNRDPAPDNFVAEATCTGVPGHCSRAVTVWRRDAIHDAGGWESDTLLEELDLSYRARMRGWRMRHVADLDIHAEPPRTVTACQLGHVRWAQGSIQVARKLLPRIGRASLSPRVKLSAALHLTEPVLYPLMLVAVLLAVPAAESASTLPAHLERAFIALVVAALLAPHALYLAAQRLVYPHWWRHVASFPALVCVGVGVAVANSRAVFDALVRRRGGAEPHVTAEAVGRLPRRHPPLLAWIEVTMGAYCAIGLGMYLSTGRFVLAPLVFAYAVGFLVTGVGGLRETYDDRAARLRRLLAGRPTAAVRALRPRSTG